MITSKQREARQEILQKLDLLPSELFLINCVSTQLAQCIGSAGELSIFAIDREIAKQSSDIDFVLAQIQAEPGIYSESRRREIAVDLLIRIAKLEILKSENLRRMKEMA